MAGYQRSQYIRVGGAGQEGRGSPDARENRRVNDYHSKYVSLRRMLKLTPTGNDICAANPVYNLATNNCHTWAQMLYDQIRA